MKKVFRLPLALFLLLALLQVSFCMAENQKSGGIRIKLGTIAPRGSSWYVVLQEMGQRWNEISGGEITMTIYPDGVAGDEPDMVRKMLIGQLNAAMMTTHGLGTIEPSVAALQDIPLLFQSDEELDYIREHLSGEISSRFERKGFVILNFGEAGWTRFFTHEPVTTPQDLKTMKLFQWAGDPVVLTLWKTMGFHPVPLAATDITVSLQTGMINAIYTTPLILLSNQWFASVNHMTDMKWAPLLGGTVMTKKVWDTIPEGYRHLVFETARQAGEQFRSEIRQQDKQSIELMKEYGLVIHHVSEDEYQQWKETVENAYPFIRGRIVPEDLFDEVVRLCNEFEEKNKE